MEPYIARLGARSGITVVLAVACALLGGGGDDDRQQPLVGQTGAPTARALTITPR